MLEKYESVCYELLRPEEVRARREARPIAYVVAGSLEWHGRQNPLGTDGLKARAICCEAALRHGGVVLPPVYQGIPSKRSWGPEGWTGYTLGFADKQNVEDLLTGVVRSLVFNQWSAIVGVTGHDVPWLVDALGAAIRKGTQGTSARGFAMMEGALHEPDEDIPVKMDHAAAWETSAMMYAHPGRVDLATLEGAPSADLERWEMRGPEGIGGVNPIQHASPELGRKIVERCGDLIGRKAKGLIEDAGAA